MFQRQTMTTAAEQSRVHLATHVPLRALRQASSAHVVARSGAVFATGVSFRSSAAGSASSGCLASAAYPAGLSAPAHGASRHAFV